MMAKIPLRVSRGTLGGAKGGAARAKSLSGAPVNSLGDRRGMTVIEFVVLDDGKIDC